MTPEPTESDSEEGTFPLDTRHYIAALERKNAQLLRENTAMDAVIAQLSEEKVQLIEALEEAMSTKDKALPEHNGRVTTTKPRKNTGKKVRRG